MVIKSAVEQERLSSFSSEGDAGARRHAGVLWGKEGSELPVKAESFAESLKFEESFEHLNVAFSAHA